jgi:acyl dehydratase
METRTLDSAPGLTRLYVKAAVPSVPGVAALPLIGRRAKDVPDLELVLPEVSVDADHLAAFDRVCGFSLEDELPATYPHVLAFPLHLALMTDGSFPFPPVGLVHIRNRIVQHRPIRLGEELALRVHGTKLEPHRRGRQFSVITEVRVGDELVWEEESVNLHKESGSNDAPRDPDPPTPPVSAEWRLAGDLGRRFAAVSGDRNPIHMHGLAAKLFGFPRAIAHGMWAKSRCLAALQGRLPSAYAVEARFRKPILLPGKVAFGEERDGEATVFAVRDAAKGTGHLDGRVTPIR